MSLSFSRHRRRKGGSGAFSAISDYHLMESLKNLRLSFFLIAALTLGGTSQDVWFPKIILIAISIVLIGLTLAETNRARLSSLIRPPFIFGILLVALYVLYLVPLPPDLWTRLPGREPIVDTYALINAATPGVEVNLPWMPLSLMPEKTLGGLLCLIPVSAVALILGTSAQPSEVRLSIDALILFAIANIGLAVLQSVLQISAVHPYETTNAGLATGLFSNANHFGLFIAMIIPFAWYRVYRRLIKRNDRVQGFDLMGPLSSIFLILAIGAIALSGSVAAIGLGALAFLGSVAITSRRLKVTYLLGLAGLGTIILLSDIFILDGLLIDLVGNFRSDSELSRANMAKTGLTMLAEYNLAGVGPGAVPEAYTQFEDPARINRVFVNQLHNDVLQFLIEFGLAGMLLCLAAIISFFALLWKNIARLSRNRRPLIFALVALLPLLHSSLDYPLRTMGIAVLFTYAWILASHVQAQRRHR